MSMIVTLIFLPILHSAAIASNQIIIQYIYHIIIWWIKYGISAIYHTNYANYDYFYENNLKYIQVYHRIINETRYTQSTHLIRNSYLPDIDYTRAFIDGWCSTIHVSLISWELVILNPIFVGLWWQWSYSDSVCISLYISLLV